MRAVSSFDCPGILQLGLQVDHIVDRGAQEGQWIYLYRAVDKQGRTVDFLLSKRRDVAAAKRFFSRATRQHGAPRVITLDGYAASHRAVA
jgi:transposase-like protein